MSSLRRRVLDESPTLGRPFGAEAGEPGGERGPDAVERELEQARERGYREGCEKAEQELLTRADSFHREVAASLERLAALEQTLAREHEAVLLEAVVEASSRVLRRSIEQSDPVAARALEEALEALPSGRRVRARLHPDDLAQVAGLLGSEAGTERIELVPDAAVSRGGTIVESDIGRIDATVETAERALRASVVDSDGAT